MNRRKVAGSAVTFKDRFPIAPSLVTVRSLLCNDHVIAERFANVPAPRSDRQAGVNGSRHPWQPWDQEETTMLRKAAAVAALLAAAIMGAMPSSANAKGGGCGAGWAGPDGVWHVVGPGCVTHIHAPRPSPPSIVPTPHQPGSIVPTPHPIPGSGPSFRGRH
jgi:hypothetical protein